MEKHEQITNILKESAKSLERLPSLLNSLLENEVKNLDPDKAKEIEAQVKELKVDEKVLELRSRVEKIINK